uniref:Uncharacterized protein n=1 Tax=uncultured marine virus TaxID=186617 RepID=A0A0F7LA19_9VIRU|nr:hypothetical protein [uncultured marine virus]
MMLLLSVLVASLRQVMAVTSMSDKLPIQFGKLTKLINILSLTLSYMTMFSMVAKLGLEHMAIRVLFLCLLLK